MAPVIVPETTRLANVPTLVMLGWELLITVLAVFAWPNSLACIMFALKFRFVSRDTIEFATLLGVEVTPFNNDAFKFATTVLL